MQEKGRDTEAASAAEETCKNIDETPVVSKSLEVEEAAKNESVGGNVDVAKCKFDVESEASEPATESKELEAGDKGHGVMDVTDAEGVNNQSTDQVEKSNTFEPSVPENAGKGEEIAESMEQVEKSNAFEPSAAENAGTKEEMAASVDPKHVDDKDVAKPTLPSLGAVNSGSFSFGTAPSSFATPTAFASFSHTWASFGSGSASGTGLGSGFAFTKAASEGAFASASSAFTSNNGSSFQLFNNTFSTAPVNAGAPLQPPPSAVQFQGGNLQTGEEEEKMVFNAEATMFEFQDGAWKERGKGEVRVNVPLNKTGKARLLMRSKGNFRLILNASLFPDMKMTSMDSRGVTFACANSAVEERSGLATYALKFKDSLAAGNFRDAVDAHKSSPQDSLKTPENSPSS
ncbi:hypothetical protein KP509_05G088800 [Ceratopteris richardii]|nr:hypothetical protein KP509_05G088800 [Ceratopteris richardii]